MKLLNNSLFITGTDTGIGKTWITALLGIFLKRSGIEVGAMKPISTGGREDAVFLKKHLNLDDPIETINPIYFDTPMSPNVAAQISDCPIEIAKIFDSFSLLKSKYDVLLVEGIGGVMVPIKENYFVRDMIKDLDLSSIIVSRSSLGMLNHLFLTYESLEKYHLDIAGVVLNDCKPVENEFLVRKNVEVVNDILDEPIIGHVPFLDNFEDVSKDLSSIYFCDDWLKTVDKRVAEGRKCHI